MLEDNTTKRYTSVFFSYLTVLIVPTAVTGLSAGNIPTPTIVPFFPYINNV